MFPRIKQYGKNFISSDLFSSKEVVQLTIPIVIDQGFVIGMALLNTAMISSAGIAAVSAVNMVESLNIFFISVFIALSTGGTVVVAQARGKRDELLAERSAVATVVAVFAIAIVLAIIVLIFHRALLEGLFGGSSEAVMKNASVYLIGSMLSYPALAIVESACGVLRGVADTRTSLFLSALTNLSYVALNLLFIQVFHLGIVGMIIALNIARLLGGCVSIWYLTKRTQSIHFSFSRLLPFNFDIMKKVMSIGFPFAAEQLFFNGGKILTQIFIVQLGTLALTANAIGNSLTMLLEIIPASLGLALVTIVGQSIGAGDTKSVRKFWLSFLALSSITTLLTSVILITVYPWLIDLFHVPASVEKQVFVLLLMVSVARIIAWPLSFITPSALRAAGDATFTSVVSLITMWSIRIVLGYILGITLGYGLLGVWAAMCFEWFVRGIIFAVRLYRGKWMRKRLV